MRKGRRDRLVVDSLEQDRPQQLRDEKMTKEERDLLACRWLESSLEEAEDYRGICGPVCDIDHDTNR
jgi:hypothetical protein